MEIKFSLNVCIEGASLDEIDNGLVQAAGERLKARILARPSVLSPQVPPQVPIQPAPLPQGLSFKIDAAVDQKIEEIKKENVLVSTSTAVKPKKETRGRKPKQVEPAVRMTGSEIIRRNEAQGMGKTEIQPAPIVENPQTNVFDIPSAAPTPKAVSPDQQAVVAAQLKNDDAVKALTKVNEMHGIDAARTVLSQFGVGRVRDLKPEDLQNFVTACEKTVSA